MKLKADLRVVSLCFVHFALGIGSVLGVEIVRDTLHSRPHVTPQKLPYLADAGRTQLYKSGSKGDTMLFRVVDMPNENLRCVFVVGDGQFGRAATCQPLDTVEGR